ncbi:MAG TPA: hypothetical protein VNC11_11840 [Gemmatimonadaceae bacterium]|jgi:hypothetical protein|nr:hypothetical protein [Gemmatimonadaceae bacterium]
MKKLLLLAASAALVACSENPTQPENLALRGPSLTVLTPPGVNLLACFEGTGTGTEPDGTCTLSADHKKAVLANNSSDTDGDVSGVYSLDDFSKSVYGELLTNVTELSYTYKSLNVPALAPTPGVLIYEIPIDALGDGTFDFWAYVDAAYCGIKPGATVNIVTMANCGIYAGSAGPYSNWADFVSHYPGARVDNTIYFIQIISARVPPAGPNSWQISNVKIGKTGLVCFDGVSEGSSNGGSCTLGTNFKSATLSNNSGDVDGDYAGVYSKELQAYGLFISNIHDLWYKYKGPVPTPGDLSYNIPIDNDADNNTTEFLAYVDATYCRGTLGAGGVYTVNITKDVNCGFYAGDPSIFFPNWAAFVAAYPNARISNGGWIFIVAERVGGAPSAVWSILDAKWGAKGK